MDLELTFDPNSTDTLIEIEDYKNMNRIDGGRYI